MQRPSSIRSAPQYTHAFIHTRCLNSRSRFNQSSYRIRSFPAQRGFAFIATSLTVQGHRQRNHGTASPAANRAKKLALDRDVIVSVLESSTTRREAQGYLKRYALGERTTWPGNAATPTDRDSRKWQDATRNELRKVAVVKLRAPEGLPQNTLSGIAKSLSQLHLLGLLAIVIVECSPDRSRLECESDAVRLCEAIDTCLEHGGAVLASNVFTRPAPADVTTPSSSSTIAETLVDDQGMLKRALQRGKIIVLPSMSREDDTSAPVVADSHAIVLALIRYLIGAQRGGSGSNAMSTSQNVELLRQPALVERLILIDPLGGIPMLSQDHIAHRFINLEQEYEELVQQLSIQGSQSQKGQGHMPSEILHAENLRLARDALRLLPPSSSALLTTPNAAASTKASATSQAPETELVFSPFGLDDMVATRRQRNPLLHNLLTDRPAVSPSLPLQRLHHEADACQRRNDISAATLIKYGIPVRILPFTNGRPLQFSPPKGPHLRLTDLQLDMPRLIYLIENSFGRKLDIERYLKRIHTNLAGIIIAGDYEGIAILTWEKAADLIQAEIASGSRHVPYLDKFAVLRSKQGSAGVADVVFNAMVRVCFPNGVCWRSRKNNPVNKWYFERAAGSCKLSRSDWTMFWTTTGQGETDETLKDYELVCRSVQSSWAD